MRRRPPSRDPPRGGRAYPRRARVASPPPPAPPRQAVHVRLALRLGLLPAHHLARPRVEGRHVQAQFLELFDDLGLAVRELPLPLREAGALRLEVALVPEGPLEPLDLRLVPLDVPLGRLQRDLAFLELQLQVLRDDALSELELVELRAGVRELLLPLRYLPLLHVVDLAGVLELPRELRGPPGQVALRGGRGRGGLSRFLLLEVLDLLEALLLPRLAGFLSESHRLTARTCRGSSRTPRSPSTSRTS